MGIKHNPIAATVPFDNTLNGFASTNVQDAIEEVATLSFAIHQAQASIIAGGVVFVCYDPLISMDTEFLSLEVQ
jgi:hypothetical protein